MQSNMEVQMFRLKNALGVGPVCLRFVSTVPLNECYFILTIKLWAVTSVDWFSRSWLGPVKLLLP